MEKQVNVKTSQAMATAMLNFCQEQGLESVSDVIGLIAGGTLFLLYSIAKSSGLDFDDTVKMYAEALMTADFR